MEQQTPIIPSSPSPPPQKNQGWNRAKAKTRQFPIIGEGKGGGYKYSIYFVQAVVVS